jgi:primosomal protein N' (replication factor Y)
MIIKVAVAGPFLTSLDYRCEDYCVVGGRVWVKVRNKKQLGLVLEINASSNLELAKILFLDEVVDKKPIFSNTDLELLLWAAHYYHEPIGNVVQASMPAKIRKGGGVTAKGVVVWQLTKLGKAAKTNLKASVKLQIKLIDFLLSKQKPVIESELNSSLSNWRNAMKRFLQLGWVIEKQLNCLHSPTTTSQTRHSLNLQQQQAVSEVLKTSGFSAFLLEGITGSGKTEVYLGIIEQVLKQGKQALVLVPEIGLTPQAVARFESYLQQPVAVIHSGLSAKERHCAWYMIKTNQIKVLLGTRSAVFTPFADLGVCILDEEHDLSFKQQDHFRYSARDCLVRRASLEDVPVVLGSATPSLETLNNAQQGKYGYLKLTKRAGGASLPKIELLDIRADEFALDNAGISRVLFTHIKQSLDNEGQVLLFLNRRGYAPVLICQDCGWQADCQSCDAHMTYHHQFKQLKCHHCGWQKPSPNNCLNCGSNNLVHQGQGTEKITELMQSWFPKKNILRVDRDSTKLKGQMQAITEQATSGGAHILVGTQMLAKGHHFPKVTLVAILDIDQGLFSCDFRAAERMAQLITQVSGRAGRAEKKGKVIIQTFNPQHPLLNTLVTQGYQQFAKIALAERNTVSLPPFSYQIMLRAEAIDSNIGWDFLQDIRQLLVQNANLQQIKQANLEVLGPVAAPMLRKEGRFRYQLLLQATNRGSLHNWFGSVESQIYCHRLIAKLRWSIDVDPQNMG